MPRADLVRLVLIAAVTLSACKSGGTTSKTDAPVHPHGMMQKEPPDPGPLAEKWLLPSRFFLAKSKTLVNEADAFADLEDARVVYVSESHHSPHDHAVQLRVIDAIRQKKGSLSIGLEMIKRPFQAHLDAYLAGDLDEDGLKEKVEWEDRWGFPFFLYRPIFRYAKTHNLPLIALNVRDEVTQTIAKEGLDGLDPDDRAMLPDLDLENAEHRAFVQDAFGGHHGHHGGHGEMNFDNFYAAQVAWDETMAYEVARIADGGGDQHTVVVLAGHGHIDHGFGIPSRAAKRGALPFKIVRPVFIKSSEEIEAHTLEPTGDLVWLMAGDQAVFPPPVE